MSAGVRWLAVITAVLVFIQAFLIGQFFYGGNGGAVGTHGWIGNLTFLGAIILTGLALYGARRGEVSSRISGLAILVTVLVIAQLGLGYSGREGGIPAQLHIPNGVLIMGLLAAILTLALTLPARPADAR
jgi:hypothetical protein